jgi:hypothetical protein
MRAVITVAMVMVLGDFESYRITFMTTGMFSACRFSLHFNGNLLPTIRFQLLSFIVVFNSKKARQANCNEYTQ